MSNRQPLQARVVKQVSPNEEILLDATAPNPWQTIPNDLLDATARLGNAAVSGITNTVSSLPQTISQIPSQASNAVTQEINAWQNKPVTQNITESATGVGVGAVKGLQNLGRGLINLPGSIANTAYGTEVIPKFEGIPSNELTQNLSDIAEQRPVSNFVGEQIPFITGTGIASNLGKGVLGKIGSGAIEGGLQGLAGDVEGPNDFQSRIANALTGATLGGTIGGIGSVAESMFSPPKNTSLYQQRAELAGIPFTNTQPETIQNTFNRNAALENIDIQRHNALVQNPDLVIGDQYTFAKDPNLIPKSQLNPNDLTPTELYNVMQTNPQLGKEITQAVTRVNQAKTPLERVQALNDIAELRKNNPELQKVPTENKGFFDNFLEYYHRSLLGSPLSRLKDVASTGANMIHETMIQDLASKIDPQAIASPDWELRTQTAARAFLQEKQRIQAGLPEVYGNEGRFDFKGDSTNKILKPLFDLQDLSLSGLDSLANGWFERDFIHELMDKQGLNWRDPNVKVPKEIIQQANKMAKEATLMSSDSKSYEIINNFRKTLNGGADKGLGNVVLPFIKYGTNAFNRKIDSLGWNLGKQIIKKLKGEKIDPRRFAMEKARTIVGWSEVALGAAMASVGAAKGGFDYNRRGLQNLQEDRGQTNDSISIGPFTIQTSLMGTIGDNLKTGIDLVTTGDEALKQNLKNSLGLSDSEAKDTVTMITDIAGQIADKMTSGLPTDRLLQTIDKNNANLLGITGEIIKGAITPSIPFSGLTKDIATILEGGQAPELRSGNPIQEIWNRSGWGRFGAPQASGVTGNKLEPILGISLSMPNELNTKLQNLYNQTGSDVFIPTPITRSYKITLPNGEQQKAYLSKEDIAELGKSQANLTNKYYNYFLNSPEFNELTNVEKVRALQSVKDSIIESLKVYYLNHTPKTLNPITSSILSNNEVDIDQALQYAIGQAKMKSNKEALQMEMQDNLDLLENDKYSQYRQQ